MDEQADGPAIVRAYVETRRPERGDRWLVRADESVVYQPAGGGERRTALIPASTLAASETWTEAPVDSEVGE